MIFLLGILRNWKVVAGLVLAASILGGVVYLRYDAVNDAVSQHELNIEREKNKFQKRIGEKNNEAERNRPADRDELIDRLRKHKF